MIGEYWPKAYFELHYKDPDFRPYKPIKIPVIIWQPNGKPRKVSL